MVNYARMEEVWRSYGPPEPIGPSDKTRGRRRGLKIGAGVAAVCLAGAAAGLYLKPDFERSPRAETRAEARRESAPSAAVQAAPPRPEPDRSLAEAEALQAQLQMAVADIAPSPAALPQAPALPPPSPAARPAPVLARRDAPAPQRAPQPNRIQRSASDFLRSLGRPAARPAPAVAPATRPAPNAQPRQASVRVAEAAPPLRTYPRSAPPPPPRPRPAPPLVIPPPVAEPAPPPAPDCSGARSPAEAMVCGSPDLAALDRRMEAELEAALAAGHRRDLLLRDQADWRRRRDAAAPDPRAVADAYQRRIGQLRSMQ